MPHRSRTSNIIAGSVGSSRSSYQPSLRGAAGSRRTLASSQLIAASTLASSGHERRETAPTNASTLVGLNERPRFVFSNASDASGATPVVRSNGVNWRRNTLESSPPLGPPPQDATARAKIRLAGPERFSIAPIIARLL